MAFQRSKKIILKAAHIQGEFIFNSLKRFSRHTDFFCFYKFPRPPWRWSFCQTDSKRWRKISESIRKMWGRIRKAWGSNFCSSNGRDTNDLNQTVDERFDDLGKTIDYKLGGVYEHTNLILHLAAQSAENAQKCVEIRQELMLQTKNVSKKSLDLTKL